MTGVGVQTLGQELPEIYAYVEEEGRRWRLRWKRWAPVM